MRLLVGEKAWGGWKDLTADQQGKSAVHGNNMKRMIDSNPHKRPPVDHSCQDAAV